MRTHRPSTFRARGIGVLAGVACGIGLWAVAFRTPARIDPPYPEPAPRTTPSVRAQLRRSPNGASDSARAAVASGNLVVDIDHADEARLVQLLVQRGGVILARRPGNLSVVSRQGRVPAADSGVSWSSYSTGRVWRVQSPASVQALGFPAEERDRLVLVMPSTWEASLAAALESALPEPVTSYRRAHLRARDTSAGNLTLTLDSVEHIRHGTEAMQRTLHGM